ncbi:hypothetical protein HY488_00630 [Candidatus Woesearchaeota archaeon]|nr:hypothetical protein [Candidatus Woesearchaeota archaeon]
MVYDIHIVYGHHCNAPRRSADGAEVYALERASIKSGMYRNRDVRQWTATGEHDRADQRQVAEFRDILLREMHEQRVDRILIEFVKQQPQP